jgi:hypothetical protein
MMRNLPVTIVAALLLTTGGAVAQDMVRTTAPSSPDGALTNQIDIGLRGTSFGADSDQARYQRYRDLRDGGTVDRFRLSKDTDAYKWNLQADHIGYQDQRFFGSYTNHGNVKLSFDWNQIPLFYSETTSTLYNTSSPGVLSLNDSVQSGIQNKTLTLQNALTGASAFDLRTRSRSAIRGSRAAIHGAAASASAAPSPPSCRCRSITAPPIWAPAWSTRVNAATPRSVTTDRSSATTCRR